MKNFLALVGLLGMLKGVGATRHTPVTGTCPACYGLFYCAGDWGCGSLATRFFSTAVESNNV